MPNTRDGAIPNEGEPTMTDTTNTQPEPSLFGETFDTWLSILAWAHDRNTKVANLRGEVDQQLADAIKERDRLAEALEQIKRRTCDSFIPVAMDAHNIAAAALASTGEA